MSNEDKLLTFFPENVFVVHRDTDAFGGKIRA